MTKKELRDFVDKSIARYRKDHTFRIHTYRNADHYESGVAMHESIAGYESLADAKKRVAPGRVLDVWVYEPDGELLGQLVIDLPSSTCRGGVQSFCPSDDR